ncbi:MAG: DUF2807 domain-containing protein [Cyclobacteriaceae bacterium]|nr:DUF2807 domain-containing protein [Cyclobacteriaceae bacterium]
MKTQATQKSSPLSVLFFICFLLASTACHETEISCLRVKNKIVSEQFGVQNFQEVYYNGPGNLYINPAEIHSLQIQAPQEVIDAFDVDVNDGMLNIRLNRCFNGPFDCDVYLSAPQFKSIEADGNAMLISNAAIHFTGLRLRTSGAARMNLEIVSDSIHCILGSSGQSTLRGVSDYLHLRHAGAGQLEAFTMAGKHVFIEQNSIGTARISVLNSLKVIQRGSGKIYYKGNPEIKSIESINPSNVIAFEP